MIGEENVGMYLDALFEIRLPLRHIGSARGREKYMLIDHVSDLGRETEERK